MKSESTIRKVEKRLWEMATSDEIPTLETRIAYEVASALMWVRGKTKCNLMKEIKETAHLIKKDFGFK